jgi:hypothetical protein
MNYVIYNDTSSGYRSFVCSRNGITGLMDIVMNEFIAGFLLLYIVFGGAIHDMWDSRKKDYNDPYEDDPYAEDMY